MEQRGVLLNGIAWVLNAGGSALLNVYDTVTAITATVLPGEKGNLIAQLREYEKKIERQYCEIGKEVVLREDAAHLSAAGETGIKRAAEYQAEIEKIKQRLQQIEEDEKAAAAAKKEAMKERVAARVKATTEPALKRGTGKEVEEERAAEKVKTVSEPILEPDVEAEQPAMAEAPEDTTMAAEDATSVEAVLEGTKDESAEAVEAPAPEMVADADETQKQEVSEASTQATPEETTDVLAETAEAPALEMAADTLEPEEQEAATLAVDGAGTKEVAEAKEAATTEELEAMLKADLLALCKEKGIEVDKRMTKLDIVELIVSRSESSVSGGNVG